MSGRVSVGESGRGGGDGEDVCVVTERERERILRGGMHRGGRDMESLRTGGGREWRRR